MAMVLTAMNIHKEISRMAERARSAGALGGEHCIAPSIYGVSLWRVRYET